MTALIGEIDEREPGELQVVDYCVGPVRAQEYFMSLLLGEIRLRLVLGLAQTPTEAEIDHRARAATEAFLRLHG